MPCRVWESFTVKPVSNRPPLKGIWQQITKVLDPSQTIAFSYFIQRMRKMNIFIRQTRELDT